MATMQTLLTCVHPRAYRHDNTLHTRTNTPRQGTVLQLAYIGDALNAVLYPHH